MKMQRVEKGLEGLKSRRGDLAGQLNELDITLNAKRAGMGAALVDGQSLEGLAAELTDLEQRRGVLTAGLAELDRRVIDAESAVREIKRNELKAAIEAGLKDAANFEGLAFEAIGTTEKVAGHLRKCAADINNLASDLRNNGETGNGPRLPYWGDIYHLNAMASMLEDHAARFKGAYKR